MSILKYFTKSSFIIFQELLHKLLRTPLHIILDHLYFIIMVILFIQVKAVIPLVIIMTNQVQTNFILLNLLIIIMVMINKLIFIILHSMVLLQAPLHIQLFLHIPKNLLSIIYFINLYFLVNLTFLIIIFLVIKYLLD